MVYGMFGILGTLDVAYDTLQAIFMLQEKWYESAGVAVSDGANFFSAKTALISDPIPPLAASAGKKEPCLGLGCIHYSNSKRIPTKREAREFEETRPYILDNPRHPLCVAHNTQTPSEHLSRLWLQCFGIDHERLNIDAMKTFARQIPEESTLIVATSRSLFGFVGSKTFCPLFLANLPTGGQVLSSSRRILGDTTSQTELFQSIPTGSFVSISNAETEMVSVRPSSAEKKLKVLV